MTRTPELRLRLDTDYVTFVDRAAAIVSELSSLQFVRDHAESDNVQACFFIVPAKSPHPGTRVWLDLISAEASSVAIRCIARNWRGGPPSYETYVSTARSILSPILRIYNQRFSARLRLTAQSRTATRPRLSPQALTLFNDFVSKATHPRPHPSDWAPFYDFAWYCHRYRLRLTEADLVFLLSERGFSDAATQEICTTFSHLQSFLSDQAQRGCRVTGRLKRAPN